MNACVQPDAARNAAPDAVLGAGVLAPDDLQSLSLLGQMASLGALAGGLIHQINNPATILLLAAS